METITLTHDGSEFEISVEIYHSCQDCGIDIGPESPPGNNCPECGAEQLAETYVYHDYIKYLFATDPPPSSVQEHADALRSQAALYEALDANDWELTRADGAHLFFEKHLESPQNPHRITRDLR